MTFLHAVSLTQMKLCTNTSTRARISLTNTYTECSERARLRILPWAADRFHPIYSALLPSAAVSNY